MANTVEIDVIANDKTKGALSKISKEFSDLTGMSLGTATAIGVVSSAVSGFIKYTKQAVEDTIKYNSEMDSLSRTLGLQIEETSRLVEISSLALITQKDFTSALEAGKKNGIDITIEGLKTLSDEYLALEGSVERNTFLVENFGKAAGPEMGKLLELGSAGIDELNGKLWENLIATESTKAQAVEFQKSMVELDNISRALGVTLGSAVIPALNDFLTMILQVTTGQKALNTAVAEWLNKLFEGTQLSGEAVKTQEEVYQSTTKSAQSFGLLGGSVSTATGIMSDGIGVANSLGQAIARLQNKTITITVRGEIDKSAYAAMAFSGQGPHNPYIGLPANSRAVGGAVAPNVPYLVGENGPEIFKPNAAGTIIPNGQVGG